MDDWGKSELTAGALGWSVETLRRGHDTIDHTAHISEVYAALRGAVYFYLLASGLSSHDADDLTQESFIRLYQRFRSGNPLKNIRPWLFRVARNLRIDQIRSRQYQVLSGSDERDRMALTLRDPGPNPEQSMLAAEQTRRLGQAIRSLTPLQIQFLHLRAEGLRYREIAEIHEVSISTVVEVIRRAIDRISKELE